MVSIGIRVLGKVEMTQRWQCQVSWHRFNNVFSAFCPGESKTKPNKSVHFGAWRRLKKFEWKISDRRCLKHVWLQMKGHHVCLMHFTNFCLSPLAWLFLLDIQEATRYQLSASWTLPGGAVLGALGQHLDLENFPFKGTQGSSVVPSGLLPPCMVSVRWVDSILSCICQPLSPTSLHVGSTEALSWYCRVHNAAVLILPAAVTEKRVGAGPGACSELLPTPSSPGTFVFSLEAAGWSWIFKGQACLSTLWWMRELCLEPFLGGQHWTWAVAESQLHNQVP